MLWISVEGGEDHFDGRWRELWVTPPPEVISGVAAEISGEGIEKERRKRESESERENKGVLSPSTFEFLIGPKNQGPMAFYPTHTLHLLYTPL